MAPIPLELPDDLAGQLRREAFERHVSQASIIDEALRAWLERTPQRGVHVNVPLAVQGADGEPFTSPEYQRALQQAVQDAARRYGEMNPGNGDPEDGEDQ